MSQWTRVTGVVEVSPMGRTQAEKTYVLETILSHQPKITGGEDDASVKYFMNNGYDTSSSHDELGRRYFSMEDGHMQSRYTVVLTGDLRYRDFKTTFKETVNWLCRLAKRVIVNNVLIKVSEDFGESRIIEDTRGVFYEMFEDPSWSISKNQQQCNRFEYLLWDGDRYSGLPLSVLAAEYGDEEAMKEIIRRQNFSIESHGELGE